MNYPVTFDADAPRRASEYAGLLGTASGNLHVVAIMAVAARQHVTSVDALRTCLDKISTYARSAKSELDNGFDTVCGV